MPLEYLNNLLVLIILLPLLLFSILNLHHPRLLRLIPHNHIHKPLTQFPDLLILHPQMTLPDHGVHIHTAHQVPALPRGREQQQRLDVRGHDLRIGLAGFVGGEQLQIRWHRGLFGVGVFVGAGGQWEQDVGQDVEAAGVGGEEDGVVGGFEGDVFQHGGDACAADVGGVGCECGQFAKGD